MKLAKQYLVEEDQKLKNGELKLSAVVEHLKSARVLDNEDIAWDEDKYPFSRQDYSDVFRYLEFRAHDNIKSGVADIFPEYLAYFNLGGTRFIWRLLIGQGSACQLFLSEGDKGSFVYDEKLETKL